MLVVLCLSGLPLGGAGGRGRRWWLLSPPAAAASEELGEFGEVHTRSCMNDGHKNDQKMIIFDFDTK